MVWMIRASRSPLPFLAAFWAVTARSCTSSMDRWGIQAAVPAWACWMAAFLMERLIHFPRSA